MAFEQWNTGAEDCEDGEDDGADETKLDADFL